MAFLSDVVDHFVGYRGHQAKDMQNKIYPVLPDSLKFQYCVSYK